MKYDEKYVLIDMNHLTPYRAILMRWYCYAGVASGYLLLHFQCKRLLKHLRNGLKQEDLW